MRFALVLLVFLATVGTGCSSGPSMHVPMLKDPVLIQQMALLSEQTTIELDASEIVAEVFTLEGDPSSEYLKLFSDSLAVSLKANTSVDSVLVRSPDGVPPFSEMRVRSERLSRTSSVPTVYSVSAMLPPAGTAFTYDGEQPPWVLLIDELRVVEQKRSMAPGAGASGLPFTFGFSGEPGIILDVRYILWDNREARPIKVGRVQGHGRERGPLLRKEINEDSFSEAITNVAQALQDDIPLAED